MTFEDFEEKVILLNESDIKSSREQYWKLFWNLHAALVEKEKSGEIVLEPDTKGLLYLRDVLENDGPEYTYTIIFWQKGNTYKKYRIGVCVRGWPILKRI